MVVSKFPISIVQGAWRRSGGRCECIYSGHGHPGRCNKQLMWHMQNREGEDGWVVMEKSFGAPPNLANCMIVCNECKRKGRTVGF